MGYLFLTGATGLLGSYLIRDLTRRGTKLAVLVRPTRFASAQHRIEGLMERWEKQAGHTLPRPVVLEGDLSRPDLGLDTSTARWASQNCEAVMHNAASLTFYADAADSEPWRSNLQGTRHVLEFSRQIGIRNFHHVSTAYVCGLRRGRINESELDLGQEHSNDYEVSKFEAEKLVRGAEFLDAPTIYRPGIILGDSQSGYTSTFHGFYVPLKLVASLITKTAGINAPREMVMAGIRLGSQRLQQILELSGREAKNFVPVDWVSAVMAKIYTHPQHHGQTYHLTPRNRVLVTMFQRVIEQVFLKYTELTSSATATNVDWTEFEKFFLDGMAVYRSYWGDDPEFDTTNTDRAAPKLPCPEFDEAMFSRMCKFAIESNFGWPRTPPTEIEFDVHKHLSLLTNGDNPVDGTNDDSVFLGLQVNGRGGGQWELTMQDGKITAAAQGLSSRCTATYYLNSKTFQRLANRKTTVEQAIGTGGVLIEGNGVPVDDLARVLQGLANGQNRSLPGR